MLNQQQLADRKNGIGGSDIAAIAGLNKYKTPLDVYLEKKDLIADNFVMNDAIHFGNLLEDIVAEEYARRTKSVVSQPYKMFAHKDHPFMLANIDRWVNDKEYVLECKTAGAFSRDKFGEQDSDQMPETYLLQCAWYAAVCDVPKVDLAVLIGGQDFRIFTYARNLLLEGKLINIASNFWNNHILKDIPPSPINQADIKTLYAQDNAQSLEATPDIVNKIERLKQIKSEQVILDEEKSGLQVDIQSFMQENALLVGSDGKPLATWKTSKPRSAIDAAKVKELYPAIYIECIKESAGSRTFLIK